MIVRAAMKYQLYPHDDTGGIIVLPLHRHSDGGQILKQLGFEPSDIELLEQGFLTDKGEFLDRRSAADHAYECGQLVEDAETERIEVLMSEDLW